jgi:hypothetical protein
VPVRKSLKSQAGESRDVSIRKIKAMYQEDPLSPEAVAHAVLDADSGISGNSSLYRDQLGVLDIE